MGSNFNVSLIMRNEVTRKCQTQSLSQTDHSFSERRADAGLDQSLSALILHFNTTLMPYLTGCFFVCVCVCEPVRPSSKVSD